MKAINRCGEAVVARLSRAILIYSGGDSHDQRQSACATCHEVIYSGKGGGPALGPGVPMDVDALQDLAITLGGGQFNGFLPGNILASSSQRLIWWKPPCRGPIWFKTNLKVKALDRMNGDEIAMPGLVFKAVSGGKLSVWAVAGKQRPTLDSKLYNAPFYNVYDGGGVCIGSARMPRMINPSNAAEFEKGFFESAGTHSVSDVRLVNHPKGYVGYCRAAKRLNSIPRVWLVPSRLTLSGILTQPKDNS